MPDLRSTHLVPEFARPEYESPNASRAELRSDVRSTSRGRRRASLRSRGQPKTPSVEIFFPETGRIWLVSEELFSDARGSLARQFFERAFRAPEVEQVEIDALRHRAEIVFDAAAGSAKAVTRKISQILSDNRLQFDVGGQFAFPASFAKSTDAAARISRIGNQFSTWTIKHEIEGRIRLQNPALLRKRELCQFIERELMNCSGIDRYSTNDLTGTVLVYYDIRQIQRYKIIEILEEVLAKSAELQVEDVDLDVPIAAASVVLAGAARFLVPALTPVSAAAFVYSVIPTFKNAQRVLFKEKRLGVDVLDAIVILACLATNQILAGTVLGFSLSVARKLVQKTEDNSKKMLFSVFGKQPRFVWLSVDGVEVETALEKVKVDDIIVVHTGETVPVDGEVVEGMAMIDQHALTGEAAPAEKLKGDKVLASTTILAGKIHVRVTSAGEETTTAKLARILNETAGYKLRSQSQGEELADKAVLPTLALGALGLATRGPAGAVAIVNCDLGTGIRMAAPIAMLSSLTLCAQQGILVKDGRALELIREVDTFLFDKTGTLTHDRPEVGRVLTFNGHSEEQILQWAAAAENKFNHPIAKAITEKFRSLELPMAETTDSKYHVGYGITVDVGGRTIRIGSARFMAHEGISIPAQLETETAKAHAEGRSFIIVGVDNAVGGALEMHAAERPEAYDVIAGLRARGAKHLAIISGDHDRPTRNLAEKLGMDRYFAEVLPQDKANYVEVLQREGRKVCFIGDGINDSIALKKADVSISLRGASSIATDTAQIVFMEDSLAKLLHLRDTSRDLQINIRRSWSIILASNLVCVGGAFFGGFGVMHSMIFNQIGGLLAVGNGLLPLREVGRSQAERAKTAAYLAEHAAI